MTYNEMKKFIYELALENKNIKIKELKNPKRLEVGDLGIIDVSQIQYCGPIGLYYIYLGDWNSKNKKIIKSIVPSTDIDVFKTFFQMVQDRIENPL